MPEFYEIDQYNLDKEWLEQPKLYHEHAIDLVNARKGLEQKKGDFDVVKAELSQTIRGDPAKYGIDKVTEAVVANMIILQREYETANDAVIDARHNVDIYQAAVTTIDHRKRALESLVTLHGQDYFSAPKSKSVSRDQVDEIEQKAVARKSSRRKRRSA